MNARYTDSSGSKNSNALLACLVAAIVLGGAIFVSKAGDKSEPKGETTKTMSDSEPIAPRGSKLSDADLHAKLTPLQYNVTRRSGTEPPFQNEYNGNHRAGIYVDRISGEPLFSSLDKFESGTGWPSFTKPISKEHVVEKTDGGFGMARTEVRSKESDSHLGHVFDDGPQPTGMRYCMNSAALRFVPMEKLKEQGYEQFLPLFEAKK